MPTFEVSVTRVSKMMIEAADRASLDELLLRMPAQLLDVSTASVGNVVKDMGKKPGRWEILNGVITLKPLRLPSRDALALVAGDHANDIAFVGVPPTLGSPDAREEIFWFIKGATLTQQRNLRGVVAPHITIQGTPLTVEFDPKFMVRHELGVWVTKEIIEAIQKIAESGPR